MTEFLDVINERDQVIGHETRTDVHARGLWHRGAHVFLFTPEGKLLIQKRSADRKQYASLLDCSVSEHVQAGETYLDAARRGTLEELGVSGLDLEPVLTFRLHYGPGDNEVSTLFQGAVNPAHVQFDPEEIQSIAYHHLHELGEQIKNHPQEFCGWFMEILRWYREGTVTMMDVLQEHTRERLGR
jgi:isopentenyl-diphosphate delta-isomerase type 1